MIRRTSSRLVIAAMVVIAGASACTPPAPSAERSGLTEVCAPADAPLAQVIVTVVSTPSYGVIRVEYPWNTPDLYDSEQITFANLLPGGTHTVGNAASALIDPGRCLLVYSLDPVVYRVSAVPVTDPGILFCYAVGLCPVQRVTGYLPGYLPSFAIGSAAVDVTGLTDATEISAGGGFTCALVAGGGVRCWGAGRALGDGTGVDTNVPVDVAGITDAIHIAAGSAHACAIVSGGAVKCWGRGDLGALGNGSGANSNVPVDVIGLTGATAITAGSSHTCAVVAAGAVKCWGDNRMGEVGSGTTNTAADPVLVPVDVVGLTGATGVAAGDGHTCARLSDGTAKCWGRNDNGALGDGSNVPRSTVPVDVVGIGDATQISAGNYQTCVVRTGGTPACWGGNWDGELGNGTLTSSNVPVGVAGLTDVAQISGGLGFTCATSPTDAWCWGGNYSRRLGDGTIINRRTPAKVVNVVGATQVAAGSGHGCALLAGGAAKCWGGGLLGNGA